MTPDRAWQWNNKRCGSCDDVYNPGPGDPQGCPDGCPEDQ